MNDWKKLLERGLQGEKLVREWLKLRGFYVLPAGLINNGGAPALEGYLRDITASDTLVAGHGMTFWAEIKTFQRAAYYQKYQRWVHGIPIRLWRQYLEGQRVTGIPGYLFILQLNAQTILEGKLEEIALGSQVTTGRHHPPSGPQIFFDVRRFQWYSLNTLSKLKVMLPEENPPKTMQPWEIGRRFPAARQLPLE